MILNISNHKQLVKREWFLLLPLLVLFPFLIIGQYPIKQFVKVDTIKYGPVIYEGDGGEYTEEWFKEQDTVKVVMLVCDTINYPYGLIGYFREQDLASSEGRLAWWQYGYDVRWVEKRNNTDGVIDPYFTYGFKYQEWNVHIHKEYLNQNKKPLKESLMVWLTKEIK